MFDNKDWQKLKKLNNKWFIASCVICVALLVSIILGMGYRRYLQHINLQASNLYGELLVTKEHETLQLYVDKLVKDYPTTTYVCLANFQLASNAIKLRDLSLAQQGLRWNFKHCRNKELRNLARVRLIRLFLEMGNLPEANSIMVHKDGEAIDDELMGDYLWKQGEKGDALQFYLKAEKKYAEPPYRLKLKLRQF